MSISNDQLAANLMECAILVKKGKRSPLLNQTLHHLTDYLTAQPPSSPTPAAQPVSPTPPEAATDNTVSKPHKPAFGKLGKIVGLGDDGPQRSESSKAATSAKNAARVKADLAAELSGSAKKQPVSPKPPHHHHGGLFAGHHEEQEWCEEHFCMGCACKMRKAASRTDPASSSKPRVTVTTTTTTTVPAVAGSSSVASTSASSSKPAFQRPVNPKSSLIANGWIEQQRRSKMRTVWKDVLASLVEGRKQGEETTLWIQREVVNASGKTELEALHQIPVKWLRDVQYLDYSTDNRFLLKVYNLQEEYIFRCPKDDDAAQNWVLTLRSAQEIAQRNSKTKVQTGVDDWENPTPNKSSSVEEEKKAEQQRTASPIPEASGHRMSVKELRAIAHGAGVKTYGMERGELERLVAQIVQEGQGGPPPPQQQQQQPAPTTTATPGRNRSNSASAAPTAAAVAPDRATDEAERRKTEEARKREDEAAKRRAEEEAHRRRVADRVREQQEMERRRKQEEERQRLAEERRKREEEEHRRRVAEQQAAEQRRREEEARRQQQQAWNQQQQAWQQQQAEEEQRRRIAEQRAAEERRRQEEAYRRQQQQWHQQQQQQHAQQQWQAPPPQQPGYRPRPPNQQYAQPPNGHGPPPPHPQHGSPPNRPGAPPPPQTSPINMKYAKMAHQTDDDSQMAIHAIKHGVLVEWALQPPMLQVLRPIETLITTVHTVFPPKFGCKGHVYFAKWTPITHEDVSLGPTMGHRPDDEKLKKAVRKLRFFLHPDKLPRDLNHEQTFMCKMLWDITSDAFEDYKKKEEDLGWIRS